MEKNYQTMQTTILGGLGCAVLGGLLTLVMLETVTPVTSEVESPVVEYQIGGGEPKTLDAFKYRMENDPEFFREFQLERQTALHAKAQEKMLEARKARAASRRAQSPYMEKYNPRIYSNSINYR